MIKLLIRRFVPDRSCRTTQARAQVGKLAGFVGILCNFILFLGKLILGILSGSVSITADALNNLTDVASSLVTLLGFHLSKRPADKDHPYGHGRYEYLSGLVVSVLTLFIGYELAKTSIVRIISPADADYSTLALILLVVCMLVKLWMFLFYRKLGILIQSTTLHATAADCRNDVLTTGAVLFGCLADAAWGLRIDSYVGLLVSIFILWSGIQCAQETISPLLGAQADENLSRQLSQMILSHDKIIGIHDLLIHDYGPDQRFATVHAELSAKYDPMLCHEIIDHIENEALRSMGIQLVIHFDPVADDDCELRNLQQSISGIVAEISPGLSIHDLRLDRHKRPHKLCFDLAIPFHIDSVYAEKQVRAKVLEHFPQYRIQIQVDRT